MLRYTGYPEHRPRIQNANPKHFMILKFDNPESFQSSAKPYLQETVRWEFSVELQTQMDLKGRRLLSRLPLVDAQLFRRKSTTGELQFRNIFGIDSNWLSLSAVEQQAGLRFDPLKCRVWLDGSSCPTPWQALPEPPSAVTLSDGSPTAVSSTLQRLHSSLSLPSTDAEPDPGLAEMNQARRRRVLSSLA